MTAPAADDEIGLQIAVMGEAGEESRRLPDHYPGRAATLEEGSAAVAILLLSHRKQQPYRRPFRRRQGIGEGEPGLDHGGAPPFHIGAPQPPDDPPFLLRP